MKMKTDVKRKEPVFEHLEQFNKDKLIEYVTSKIKELPDDKLLGFYKYFPYGDTDNYETIQLTLQSCKDDYITSTLKELEKQVKEHEEKLKESKKEFTKEYATFKEEKEKNKRLYSQVEKDKENYFKVFALFSKEAELQQKKDKLDYQENYVKENKKNIDYFKKALNEG